MSNGLEIRKCEVCGSEDLRSVLDLGVHPLCDDLIPIGSAERCETFPIDVLFCPRCRTAHQRFQVPKIRLFPRTYHYRSRFTADVLSGMSELVQSVEGRLGTLRNKTVVDVGCNDGSLLDRFAAAGARTIGVEPTGAYQDALGRSHIVVNDFFSKASARRILQEHGAADIITFTNVFAHIEDLPSLLEAVRILMGTDSVLVIENHYLGAVLSKNQFDTFYHEHPRTYSLTSFVHIAETLGRAICAVEFPSRYGGNIRVTIGGKDRVTQEGRSSVDAALLQEADFLDQFAAMRSRVDKWKHAKKEEIGALVREHGSLLAKAFPGRAAILIALLGLSEREIECVYEKPGSLKIGHYVPGTRIPIKSDDELFARLAATRVILNLAWHIPGEIESYLRGHGYRGRLIHAV
jgi:SAM-dependent methyltransferase